MVNNVYVSAVTKDNVNRFELVAFVNALLHGAISKVEEMSTGAAYCQLTHILFPDNISLKKVKWNSKADMDHINNWKILGVAWKEIGIDKPVPVEKLVKAKFQDNYEFLQWFYKFFNANRDGVDTDSYDALGNRGGVEYPAGAKGPAPGLRQTAPRAALPARQAAAPAPKKLVETPTLRSTAPVKNGSSAVDKAAIAELEQKLAANTEALETAERERDFYFNKLRFIEDMCNELQEGEHLDAKKVLEVLYSQDDVPHAEEEEEQGLENIAPAETTAVLPNLDDSETF